MTPAHRSTDLAHWFARLAAPDREPGPRRFPSVELITRRVRLRAYAETDASAHREIFDHPLARQWSIAPQPYSAQHATRWCATDAAAIRTRGDGICWAAEDRASGRLVGLTGLHDTDWSNGVTDVSATLAGWALGHGYATEGLRAIARWVLADQGFNRLQIRAARANRTSRLVAASCGFVEEGTLRNAAVTRFGRTDVVVYSLIPKDLPARPPVAYTVRDNDPIDTSEGGHHDCSDRHGSAVEAEG